MTLATMTMFSLCGCSPVCCRYQNYVDATAAVMHVLPSAPTQFFAPGSAITGYIAFIQDVASNSAPEMLAFALAPCTSTSGDCASVCVCVCMCVFL